MKTLFAILILLFLFMAFFGMVNACDLAGQDEFVWVLGKTCIAPLMASMGMYYFGRIIFPEHDNDDDRGQEEEY